MAKKPTYSYAAIMKSSVLAEKILKFSGSDTGETQKLSALLKLVERLDDLTKKTYSGKIISKVIKRYNPKIPTGHKAFTETEIVEKREDVCERDYDEACSIFKEAANAGIELPNIPAVDGTFWSFKLLHHWCNESLFKISKLLQNYIRKITNGAPTQEKQNGGNVDWDDPAYIPNSDAIKIADNRIRLSALSKLLKSNKNNIRYIKYGNRCKVHIQDFKKYLIKLSPDYFSDKVIDDYLSKAEKTKEQIRREKNT